MTHPEIYIPVSRSKAATRGVSWVFCAIALVAVSFRLYAGFQFGSSVVSSRIVDMSLALLALPIPLAALFCTYRGLRWLLLAGWLGQVGVFANDQELVLKLGTYGNWRFDVERMDAKYPFELSVDAEGEYEAFLPEEEQMATLIPRLLHPESPEPIGRTIQRFVDGDEASIVETMRPVFDVWRAEAARSAAMDAAPLVSE